MVKQIMKILVIRTDRIGEVLLSTPILTALKEKWPMAEIAVMVKPEVKELVEDNPCVNEIIEYGDIRKNKGKEGVIGTALKLRKLFKERKFDAAIIVNPKKEFHLAVFLAGIPVRVGFDRKWGFLLTHRVRDLKSRSEKHEVEYNLDLVRTLGIEPKDKRPVLVIKDKEGLIRENKGREGKIREDKEIEKGIRGKGLVAVHPCTSNPKKQWPPGHFAKLGDLLAEAGYDVAIIGGAECAGTDREVISKMKNPPQDLVGRTGLKELARFLKGCRLLVSGDSGPVHIAAAVGTNVVALFGSADPGSRPVRWGPYGDGHIVMQKERIEDIKPEEVFKKCVY